MVNCKSSVSSSISILYISIRYLEKYHLINVMMKEKIFWQNMTWNLQMQNISQKHAVCGGDIKRWNHLSNLLTKDKQMRGK